jgi:hypothetical protein
LPGHWSLKQITLIKHAWQSEIPSGTAKILYEEKQMGMGGVQNAKLDCRYAREVSIIAVLT